MLSFFVDGSLENTQLSKLPAVQSVPGSQRMVDTTVLSSKKLKVLHFFYPLKRFAVGVLVSPDSPFPSHSSLSARISVFLCRLFLFTCTEQRQLFANLDSRSWNNPASSTAVSQSRVFITPLGQALTNHGALLDSRHAPCHRDWRENHFIQNISQSFRQLLFSPSRLETHGYIPTI